MSYQSQVNFICTVTLIKLHSVNLQLNTCCISNDAIQKLVLIVVMITYFDCT